MCLIIYGGLMFEVVWFGFGGTSLTPLAPVPSGMHFSTPKLVSSRLAPCWGLPDCTLLQLDALFQRHPLASKLLVHFSKCLRCTCSIYQLAPHFLQSSSLRSLASDFVNASFSKEVQISSIIWLCHFGHLAPDTSTISFSFPPFSVVPVK